MKNRHILSISTVILAASLALGACNNPAPSDQTAIGQTPASATGLAPAASELPASGPIRPASAGVVREPYRYIDDAYALGDAFGDSPPDYTIDYGGTRPLIWRTRSGDYRMIERTDDGDRAYYYHAGADRPFLVRDPRYAYAYDGGALVVIYDASGRPVSQAITARDADVAGRYLSRAAQLYRAALQQQRLSAEAADWQARRNTVLAQQRDWLADQQRNDDWRRWRDEQSRRQHANLGEERSQRQAAAARFDGATAATSAERVRDQAEMQQRRQDAQAPATGQRQLDLQADAGRRAQAMAGSQAAQPQQRAEADRRNRIAADDYRRGQDEARAQRRQADARQTQVQAMRVQAAQARAEQAKVDQAKVDQAKVEAAKVKAAKAEQTRVSQVQAEQTQRAKADTQARRPAGAGHGKGKAAGDGRDDKHDEPKS
jgi:hypothetical protein